jgi:hypothetical protein
MSSFLADEGLTKIQVLLVLSPALSMASDSPSGSPHQHSGGECALMPLPRSWRTARHPAPFFPPTLRSSRDVGGRMGN